MTRNSINGATSAAKSALSKTSKRERVPPSLRFPLLVLSSLTLSVLLYTFIPNITGYELATVSRSLNRPYQPVLRVVIKVLELAIAWKLGLDAYDYGSLFLLYSSPYYALLATFYDVDRLAIVFAATIDLIANVAPFYALRSLNIHNRLQALRTEDAILAALNTVNTLTTLFAAGIYGVVIYSSLFTWLPIQIVRHFDYVPTLEHAHGANLVVLILACIPLGFAAKNFLFVPSIAAPGAGRASKIEAQHKVFDPATASFSETLAYNLGIARHWGIRDQILVKRTVVVVIMTLLFSLTKIYGTVHGASAWGSLAWGSVFALASSLIGLGYVWVGDV